MGCSRCEDWDTEELSSVCPNDDASDVDPVASRLGLVDIEDCDELRSTGVFAGAVSGSTTSSAGTSGSARQDWASSCVGLILSSCLSSCSSSSTS
jgi:hypothetical protein